MPNYARCPTRQDVVSVARCPSRPPLHCTLSPTFDFCFFVFFFPSCTMYIVIQYYANPPPPPKNMADVGNIPIKKVQLFIFIFLRWDWHTHILLQHWLAYSWLYSLPLPFYMLLAIVNLLYCGQRAKPYRSSWDFCMWVVHRPVLCDWWG